MQTSLVVLVIGFVGMLVLVAGSLFPHIEQEETEHKQVENAKADAQARMLARKAAAENGDAEAQILLGHIFYFGQGVTKNEMEAVRWFRKAAEKVGAENPEVLNSLVWILSVSKAANVRDGKCKRRSKSAASSLTMKHVSQYGRLG